jgi:hypothetical protein
MRAVCDVCAVRRERRLQLEAAWPQAAQQLERRKLTGCA